MPTAAIATDFFKNTNNLLYFFKTRRIIQRIIVQNRLNLQQCPITSILNDLFRVQIQRRNRNLDFLIREGMEQYFLFSNAMNLRYLEVLDLYVYNLGIAGTSYSYATAVSILKSLVGIVLLISANGLSKKIRGYGIL